MGGNLFSVIKFFLCYTYYVGYKEEGDKKMFDFLEETPLEALETSFDFDYYVNDLDADDE